MSGCSKQYCGSIVWRHHGTRCYHHIFHSAHGSIYEQFDFQASNLLDCDQADALQEIDSY